MKKAIRLDLIKLINADTFVAFDNTVRDMMTRAHENNIDAPYIEVNDTYTTYQCFLNAFRLGKYSAADFIHLCYETTCLWHDDGVVAGDELPVELAAVEYTARVYMSDCDMRIKYVEQAKETVDELASCLKSFLFGKAGTLAQIATKCDDLRVYWGALNRDDVTAKDRAETLDKIATLLCAMQGAVNHACIAANDWAAQAKATVEAVEAFED